LKRLLDDPWWHGLAPPGAAGRFELARAYVLYATSTEAPRLHDAALRAVTSLDGAGDGIATANALLCLASAHASRADLAQHFACLGPVHTTEVTA